MTLWESQKVKRPLREQEENKKFFQWMLNRLYVGFLRYGQTCADKKYFTRAKLELKKYQETGNKEHLVNAANYCFLESYAPENKKAHSDNSVDSATRHKV